MKIKKKKNLKSSIVLGIDQSLNGSAFLLMKDFEILDYYYFTNVVKNSKCEHAILNRTTGIYRLNFIYDWFNKFLFSHDIDYAAIENYAFGAKSNSVFQMGGLGEMLRLSLFKNKVPYKEYEPARVKKYATGKGNAEKSQMVLAAFKDGFDVSKYGKSGEDLSDAYWIAQMLNNEICIHKNKDYLKNLSSKKIEIFTEETKSNPVALINRPFIS
jgi:Holliday junction resolvasome RuvABC endonuclease subunit